MDKITNSEFLLSQRQRQNSEEKLLSLAQSILVLHQKQTALQAAIQKRATQSLHSPTYHSHKKINTLPSLRISTLFNSQISKSNLLHKKKYIHDQVKNIKISNKEFKRQLSNQHLLQNINKCKQVQQTLEQSKKKNHLFWESKITRQKQWKQQKLIQNNQAIQTNGFFIEQMQQQQIKLTTDIKQCQELKGILSRTLNEVDSVFGMKQKMNQTNPNKGRKCN